MLLILAASKVKSVTSTILMNCDLHNANLAAILSVVGFGSVNRKLVNRNFIG